MTVLLQIFPLAYGKTYNVWYDCGFLVICGLFLFKWFSFTKFIGSQKWWTWLSRNSFGIYLIHFPLIMVLQEWAKSLPLIMPVKVMLLCGIVLAISILICRGINHFPRLSKLLLYNR